LLAVGFEKEGKASRIEAQMKLYFFLNCFIKEGYQTYKVMKDIIWFLKILEKQFIQQEVKPKNPKVLCAKRDNFPI